MGLEEAVSRLDRVSSKAQSKLRIALALSLRDVQEEARAKHRFTTRTGTAERSIETKTNYTTDDFSGTVGTTRDITVFLHQGTKAHVIRPRHKLALRWTNGGSFVFAKRVWHPAIKKDPFIFDAAKNQKGKIYSRFELAVRMAIEEAY